MLTDLVWPVLCLAIGLLLVMAEVFLPSGGLLGLSACLFLGAALWIAFAGSMAAGTTIVVLIGVLMPATLMLAARFWPYTPVGRWLSLSPPTPEDLEPAPSVAQGTRLEYLVGQYGRSLTPLRPSGTVELDGRRFDGLSEEGMIPSGVLVRAIRVRGGQVVVRAATDEGLDAVLSEPAAT